MKKKKKIVRATAGGGQNFEQRNVERLKFQNFKVANIKITNDELFDSFIIEFIFLFVRYYLNTHNFSNCKILIFQMVKQIKCSIFKIVKF